jgi:hypothetical protein
VFVGGTVTVWVTVLVLVLVLTLVDTVVLVVGGEVVVVAVVAVGLSVDDVVVAASVVVVVGSWLCVTVPVPPVGTGATPADGEVVELTDVVEVGLEASPPANETIAYTITATRMTASAPMLTRPAGRRYHGVGGAGGGGCCPYSGRSPYGCCPA